MIISVINALLPRRKRKAYLFGKNNEWWLAFGGISEGKSHFRARKAILIYKLRLIDLHISDITVVNPYLLFKVGSVLNVDEFSLKLEAKD